MKVLGSMFKVSKQKSNRANGRINVKDIKKEPATHIAMIEPREQCQNRIEPTGCKIFQQQASNIHKLQTTNPSPLKDI